MTSAPIRVPCPAGACTCDYDRVVADTTADQRVLLLTREQEKRLVARLEQVSTLPDLRHVCERIEAQLGVVVTVAPGAREVRTARGIDIQLRPLPGLCRKTQKTIPAAIRRCLEANPQIVYALLDADSLFGDSAHE